MLNKITNINSGLEQKHAVKFRQYKKNGSGTYQNNRDSNDSINISPALAYFENNSWKLRNINKTPDNKVYLEFAIHEFDFKVTLDIAGLSNLGYLKYSVHKINEMSINKNLIQVDILVELKKRMNLQNYDSLNMLDVLFSRISRLNLNSELSRNDTKSLNELLETIQLGLFNEFESLSNVMLNFLEKYLGVKIDLKRDSGRLIENDIAIDRIKIIHV